MKITHNKVGQNLNLKDTAKSDKAAKAEKNSGAASPEGLLNNKDVELSGATNVKLSQRAQDIKKAKELALAAPDIREDKVARLQKLIDEGNYKVDAKDIADKMVDEEAQWL